MSQPFLTLTATQRIRAFLDGAGLEVAGWCSVSEVLDALRGLLSTRADDDVFWGRLVYLLDELQEAQRRDGLAAREAEILGEADLDALIEELRTALRRHTANQPTSSFLKQLTAGSLTAFLVLGMATGCKSSSNADTTGSKAVTSAGPDDAATDEAAKVDASTAAVPAPESDATTAVAVAETDAVAVGAAEPENLADTAPETVAEPDTAVAPQPQTVQEYVAASDLSEDTRAALLQCLDRQTDQQRLDLLELFRTQTPEEIAKALEAYVDSEVCTPRKERRRKPRVVEPVPMYKGVSFPPRPS